MQFTVKQARTYAGLTQADMAKALGISRDTYIKIERDISRATVGQVNEISKCTGVPLTEIFLPGNSTLVENDSTLEEGA